MHLNRRERSTFQQLSAILRSVLICFSLTSFGAVVNASVPVVCHELFTSIHPVSVAIPATQREAAKPIEKLTLREKAIALLPIPKMPEAKLKQSTNTDGANWLGKVGLAMGQSIQRKLSDERLNVSEARTINQVSVEGEGAPRASSEELVATTMSRLKLSNPRLKELREELFDRMFPQIEAMLLPFNSLNPLFAPNARKYLDRIALAMRNSGDNVQRRRFAEKASQLRPQLNAVDEELTRVSTRAAELIVRLHTYDEYCRDRAGKLEPADQTAHSNWAWVRASIAEHILLIHQVDVAIDLQRKQINQLERAVDTISFSPNVMSVQSAVSFGLTAIENEDQRLIPLKHQPPTQDENDLY